MGQIMPFLCGICCSARWSKLLLFGILRRCHAILSVPPGPLTLVRRRGLASSFDSRHHQSVCFGENITGGSFDGSSQYALYNYLIVYWGNTFALTITILQLASFIYRL
ncbi:MAG: hypothetical protein ACLR2G_09630 [Phascolarctobacterium faecium]